MELSVHFDKITGLMGRLKSRETARASDAGEDRQEIGEMLELTGVNKKAFSWTRALDKMEPEKREDVLRSFDALRDMLDPHWEGQSTPDMLDGEPPADEAPEEDTEDDPQTVDVGPHVEEEDAETEEFNAAVDEATEAEDGVVTPINLGATG